MCPSGRNCEIKAHFSIFEVAGRGIEVEVSDNAKAFDPLSLPLPDLSEPLERRTADGLGVFLIRSMMDEVRYQHFDGRNHLLFRKYWAQFAPTVTC